MITTTLLMVAATHVGRKLNLPFCVNISGEATFSYDISDMYVG